MLIESYTEKDVKFAGIAPDISPDLDPSSRTAVLTAIDQAKKTRRIPSTTNRFHDAVFYIDAYNIKLSSSDKNEDLLLRLPIHQVAAISYLWADKQHTLAVKFGGSELFEKSETLDPESCHLAVMYCDSRETAEKLCLAVEQSFQLAYTEATMTYFDRTVREGARSAGSVSARSGSLSTTSSVNAHDRQLNSMTSPKLDSMTSPNLNSMTSPKLNSMTSPKLENIPSPDITRNTTRCLSPNPMAQTIGEQSKSLGFLSRSMSNLGINSTLSSGYSRSLSSQPTRHNSGNSELTTAANDLILEYMSKLRNKLSTSELEQFAHLMTSWKRTMDISTFCERILELYGPGRKHLLAEMRPFIPASDIDYFEQFLNRHVFVLDRRESQEFEDVNIPVPGFRPRLSILRSPWHTDSMDQDLDRIDRNSDEDTDLAPDLGLRSTINMPEHASD